MSDLEGDVLTPQQCLERAKRSYDAGDLKRAKKLCEAAMKEDPTVEDIPFVKEVLNSRPTEEEEK